MVGHCLVEDNVNALQYEVVGLRNSCQWRNYVGKCVPKTGIAPFSMESVTLSLPSMESSTVRASLLRDNISERIV